MKTMYIYVHKYLLEKINSTKENTKQKKKTDLFDIREVSMFFKSSLV